MRLLLALALIVITHTASAAYTYTYTNIIPTINTDFYPIIFGGEPIKETRERTISFSTLLNDKIRPNTTYQQTDLLANAFIGINPFVEGEGYSKNFISSLYPFIQVSFQTDSYGQIIDWNLNASEGPFRMSCRKGFDEVSLSIPLTIEEGETFNVGNWKEQKVTYVKDALIDYETTYSVTPVPEPKSYGMMLLGLGLIGLIARRKV